MIQQQTVSTCKPLDDRTGIIVTAVKGVKNKEPATQIIGEEINAVIAEIAEFSQIGGDFAANEQACDTSIALLMVQLKLALFPATAPAAVSAPVSPTPATT